MIKYPGSWTPRGTRGNETRHGSNILAAVQTMKFNIPGVQCLRRDMKLGKYYPKESCLSAHRKNPLAE